uniref:Uncharacterized protein n=1 Tax=Timema shepardi TaxID=629360 RepID=A0A7R9ALW1_TIMSH|nr:unnamed protein product [Timema shepardi]
MLVCLNVSEIGSCSNLTIISVRNNKLQEVPAELGHLPSIRMINLSENLLCNLPVSILKLSHLTALWLSNNQNTPLVTLHKEIDKETRQTVCVNFMLPQTFQDRYVALPKGTANNSNEEHTPRSHPHIWFATETTEDKSCGLLRAPTPYPKELRAMSKHVRNMQQSSKRASREKIQKQAALLDNVREALRKMKKEVRSFFGNVESLVRILLVSPASAVKQREASVLCEN